MFQWLRDWWDDRTKGLYTVVFDASIFRDQHALEFSGRWEAYSFARKWISDHQHGEASIVCGKLPPLARVLSIKLPRPKHSCEYSGSCLICEERK
jgi:hypothetical protein